MTAGNASLTFWYEFASTYSYLSAMRIEGLSAKANVQVVWRPFLLGPIFQSQGWNTSPFNLLLAKGRYMWRDMERLCADQGLPAMHRPDPFPQHSLLAARVATLGEGEHWLPEFSRRVYLAEFCEGQQVSEPEVLAGILDSMGLDGAALIRQVGQDQAVKDRLRLNTEEAIRLGIFGAPAFTTQDGELFWGDDRLEQAVRWAQDHA